jgi:hypothetical protein
LREIDAVGRRRRTVAANPSEPPVAMAALTVAVDSNWRHAMRQHIVKTSLTALLITGALAGCATSVDWGGPLLHYRYNYDSRPVVSEAPVVVPARGATYDEPAVVYRESTVTRYPDSTVTYRTYREPVVTDNHRPTVVYGYQAPTFPYGDKGQ